MFGSRIVNRVIYETLSAAPALTAVVGNRIYRGVTYPQGTTFPAVLFYMEQSSYDAGGHTERAEHITAETMRFVVRCDDRGTSDTRIATAAQAQLDALAGLIVDTPDGEQVTFTAQGEVPITSYIDGDQTYQRLGTIYGVTVTQGGF